MSGAKSRCSPQAAIIVLTLGCAKCASRKSRGVASNNRSVSSSQPVPLLPPRLPDRLRGVERGHRRTQKREDMRRVDAEARDAARARPARRSATARAIRSTVLSSVCADAEKSPVAKHGGEAIFGGREARARAPAARLCGLRKRPSRRTSTGSSRRRRGESPAASIPGSSRRRRARSRPRRPRRSTLFRKPHRCRQAVVACANDHRVISHRPLSRSHAPRGANSMQFQQRAADGLARRDRGPPGPRGAWREIGTDRGSFAISTRAAAPPRRPIASRITPR